jgi:hypothetical protein
MFLVWDTTPTKTHSTYTLYAGESDGCEIGNTVTVQPSKTVGDAVGDAISTLGTEISELDPIGVDETVIFDQSGDMPYKIDA